MKKLLSTLLLVVFLAGTSVTATASQKGHNDNRQEQRHSDRHSDKQREKDDKQREKDAKRREQEQKKIQQIREKAHKHQAHMQRGYGANMHAMHKHQLKMEQRYERRLHDMVRHSTYGGRDIALWQIDHDTFIVRYFKDGRYYTRRLYPYTGRYGMTYEVATSWLPQTPWININISL